MELLIYNTMGITKFFLCLHCPPSLCKSRTRHGGLLFDVEHRRVAETLRRRNHIWCGGRKVEHSSATELPGSPDCAFTSEGPRCHGVGRGKTETYPDSGRPRRPENGAEARYRVSPRI